MKKLLLLPAVVACAGLLLFGSVPAFGATTSNDQDQTFMTKNAQTDLAEIAIGKIALQRSTSTQVQALATKTMADHEAALTKLQGVAGGVGFTLPGAPNAEQQSDAAKLSSVDAAQFDLTYAQVQVVGHNLSISDTNTELSSGQNSALLSYATGYLPVAQMHLTMADALLSALGGSVPGSAPAGTGGLAASTPAGVISFQVVVVGLGLLVAGAASTVLIRRRRVHP